MLVVHLKNHNKTFQRKAFAGGAVEFVNDTLSQATITANPEVFGKGQFNIPPGQSLTKKVKCGKGVYQVGIEKSKSGSGTELIEMDLTIVIDPDDDLA